MQADHKEKVQGCVEGRILSLAVYIEEAGSDLCPWEPLLCDCAPNVSLLSLLVLFNCDNKLSLKWVFFISLCFFSCMPGKELCCPRQILSSLAQPGAVPGKQVGWAPFSVL